MAGGNRSKQKGNGWEREVASFLAELFGKPFIRVPSSGAFIGGQNRSRKDHMSENQIRGRKGDIIPPDEFKFAVLECKFYADFPFHSLMINEDVKKLDEWIDQASSDCDENDKWIVIFKINRRGAFVAYNPRQFIDIKLNNYCEYKGNRITNFEEFFTNNKEYISERWVNI